MIANESRSMSSHGISENGDGFSYHINILRLPSYTFGTIVLHETEALVTDDIR